MMQFIRLWIVLMSSRLELLVHSFKKFQKKKQNSSNSFEDSFEDSSIEL